MKNNRSPIGVFDSGVGGLTVLRALMRRLPHERFVYVGDTARVPYGTKSPEAVKRFSLEIARFLKKRRVKAVVVACNTVSAVALPELRRFLPVPVMGVLEPGATAAARATRTGRVGVIGTSATVRSRAYEREIRRLNPALRVFSRPCPLFVPLVEEGWLTHPVTRRVAQLYLSPILAKRVDALVLGCTHYPLLKTVLKSVARNVSLIDSAEETAKSVKRVLERKDLLARSGRGSGVFFSSDDPDKFMALGHRFLGGKLRRVRRIHLDGV
ncbi:MAG TPA: glutamate racemase [Elusimicrobiota bacterium]|nr:glutamate racemase [Elusimicrobiota bacterium]